MFETYRHIEYTYVKDIIGEDAMVEFMIDHNVNNDSSIAWPTDEGGDIISEALIHLGAEKKEVVYIDFCW